MPFLTACYIERRKFSHHPVIINSSTNFRLLFIDTSGYRLYSGCFRALPFARSGYLSTCTTSIVADSCAMNIKGRGNDRHEYIRNENRLSRQIFERFLFICLLWRLVYHREREQQIEFNFNNNLTLNRINL